MVTHRDPIPRIQGNFPGYVRVLRVLRAALNLDGGKRVRRTMSVRDNPGKFTY